MLSRTGTDSSIVVALVLFPISISTQQHRVVPLRTFGDEMRGSRNRTAVNTHAWGRLTAEISGAPLVFRFTRVACFRKPLHYAYSDTCVIFITTAAITVTLCSVSRSSAPRFSHGVPCRLYCSALLSSLVSLLCSSKARPSGAP